jgi:hypothetical protein
MADNLAPDDKSFPSISGEVNNLLNKYPPPGGGAPVVAAPTTTAGKAGTDAATVEIIQPGKRTQNPLGNFSSYTYQISLYMITPDAYEAFLLSGRKDINATIDITPTENQTSRDATTSNSSPTATSGSSPPSSSSNSSKKPGGVYLIAQSGGINNTNSKRAPGFELDFFIDNLSIQQNIGTKEVESVTNYTTISFTITEPYGFSLLTKLRKAQTALAAVTNTPNFNLVQDPARQIYMLGIKFLGYDKDGYLIDPTKIPSADGDPQGNAFGLYQRYYDILLRELKFKITGKAVTYNIVAGNASSIVGFGSKFSTVWQDINVTADTVQNALTGGVGGSGKPGESLMAIAGAGGMVGLLSKLNYDQKQLLGKGVLIAREYAVTFIGPDSDKIKNATLVSPDDLDKRKVPTSGITKTSQSNEKESANTPILSSQRTIKIAQGTSIIQAVNDIIKQSSYMEDALSAIAKTKLTPDADTKSNETGVKDESVSISWYNMHAEVKNLGWDTNQGDYVYKINYIIQPYSTPIVVAASARVLPQYYGPHKRYEYWFTGKNSEVIGYEQNMDYAYYNVTVGGFGVEGSAAQGGATDTASIVGQPQDQPSQGRINEGMEAQNAYMTSLFSPRDFGNAKIKILGDPDFLMQPAPSSINDLYNQFYGTDRFTINPNGGQVFIEINFKEPLDYENGTGLMGLNQSIYFWKYPESVQKAIDKRGGGVSFMVKQVISTFSKGKFEQELVCSLNTFDDPGPDKKDEGREDANQSNAETARLNRSGTGSGSAPTPDGTGTTAGTGFNSSASSTFLDPAQKGALASLNSVGSINNVMDPMQKLAASTVTIPTKLGPTVNDDAGP